jgi:prepilin-type N-terminal cleavage/methylation domain-containing protein
METKRVVSGQWLGARETGGRTPEAGGAVTRCASEGFLLSSPITSHQSPITARLRRAFTLTEILVVITIIAILASLTSVAVIRGLDTAKQTRQKVEVDALDAAFKAYKEKYGSYPPCDLRFRTSATAPTPGNPPDPYFNAALRQHIARAFPRYQLANLETDLIRAGVDTTYYRPDQAIVFWLSGFNPDATRPFTHPDYDPTNNPNKYFRDLPKSRRTPAFFDFDNTRFAVNDTRQSPPASIQALPSYFPSGPKLTTTAVSSGAPYQPDAILYPKWESGCAPYVYIDAHPYPVLGSGSRIVNVPFYGMSPADTGGPIVANPFNAGTTPSLPVPAIDVPTIGQIFPEKGIAVAYWNDLNNNSHGWTMAAGVDIGEDWVNPDSFQIIAPGGDGNYGSKLATNYSGARMYPIGTIETSKSAFAQSQDEDNVTNFCQKARLEDAKP